jgi:heat shock protein HtpX
MFSLNLRMYLLLGVLFAIVYAIISMIGAAMGVTNFYFYIGLSVVLMVVQYWIGPWMVEWSMGVKYVTKGEYPRLHEMVEELARKAGIPKPRVAVAPMGLPNAFAFGRGWADGRVCVTQGILKMLDENELRAVLGHELSHIKNRDVLTITLLSVIPMVLYRIAWGMMWSRGGSRRGNEAPSAALIGLAAFLFYFITNLLVLYASRIREYFADRGSVALGNPPSALASALYKLVYGSARADQETLHDVQGMKAFFINDPSRATQEIRELRQLDLDRNGTIDDAELKVLERKNLNLGFADKMMELLSTHPNMLKRIKALSAASRH